MLVNVQLPKKSRISVEEIMKPLRDKPQQSKKADREYLREQFPDAFKGGES